MSQFLPSITPDEFLGPLSFLVCGLPGKARESRIFLMLVAHIDDSGTEGPKNNEIATLAGFIAKANDWQAFSAKWKLALDGPPKLNYFRSVEAHRCRDEFQHFSKEERDARVDRLHGLIAELSPIGICSYVRWDDFEHFKKGFTRPIEAYAVLFQNVVFNALNLVRIFSPEEQIEIVFDEQGTLGAKAASVTDWATLSLSDKYRKHLAGRPVHRNDKRIIPLQAADVLAWSFRRAATANGIDPSKLPPRFSNLAMMVSHLDRRFLAKMHANALEMSQRFPGVDSEYSEEKLKQIRNAFLGYDPDQTE